MKLLVLSAKEIENSLEHDELRKCMRLALKFFSRKNADNIPRKVFDLIPEFKLGFMPAHSMLQKIVGYKAVSFIPSNQTNGLNPHQGLISLLDFDTGRVKAILDGSAVTAFRTAAVSAAATDELSRKESETLAIIGAGRQAFEHIQAILKIRQIKNIRIFSRSENSARLLLQKLNHLTTCRLHVVTSVLEAIKGADIVVTCTPSREPLFSLKDVAPGVHINAIGACRPGFHEIQFCSRQGLKVYLDSKTACADEASEISEVAENDIAGELGECFSNAIPSRTRKSDITVFKSVGLGITDLFAADYFYRRALALGLGQAVDFSEGV